MRITIGDWIRCASLILSLAIGGGTARAQIGRSARSFPDSSGQILIFTDQLPSQPTTGQWNFIASHYVGTQKELLSWTQTVRRINPGTKSVKVPLDGTYYLVASSGGGAVGSNGKQPGSLSTSVVTTVTIPAHSARVLLY